jgi:hypothetical protein
VTAGEPSDPYLMTGFEHKCVHVQNLGSRAATVTIEAGPSGNGRFGSITSITAGAGELATYVFPSGFSCHWARLVSDTDAALTAQFFYT